ncbi:MAG TPA: glycosyltransferase family 39 protein [Bryobacteraceae bacterium]|nr:glycosyltransferase family 39 protein [Bryobacteraceae bacterium]
MRSERLSVETDQQAEQEFRITAMESVEPRSFARLATAHPRFFLAVLTIIYGFGAILAANRRHFEFDEIMTYSLAELLDIRQIWTAIGKGIELNPPLPFWLAWIIHHTIGGGEIASRIPAIFGFWLMCFCIYHFVWRRCGTVFGFVAFLLPLFTYPASDAAVARGYGLMLGLSALALLCWQLAFDGVHRALSLAGLAVGIAGAVSCHYYAVYVVGALSAGELARTLTRRRVDAAVWAALAAGLSPLALYAPLLRSAAAGALKNFWVSAQPQFIYESYADLLGPTAMVFLLLLSILLRPGKRAELEGKNIRWALPALQLHECTACFVLVAMPFVLYLAGLFAKVPFYTRYVMPVTIGFSITMAAFAHRIGGGNPRLQRVLLSLLVWCCLLPWVLFQISKQIVARPPAEYLESRPQLPADTSLPVVFDSETDFIEYFHYGSLAVRSRIFNLIDREAAIKYRGTDTGLRSMAVAQTFRDIHAVDYHQFVTAHPAFYLMRLREEGWTLQKLLADGASVQLLRLEKDKGTFVQSHTIFRVTMPGR